MSKVFGTIAAVFLAASAFIAFKNKEAYQGELELKKTSDQLEKSTQKDLVEEQTRLATAEGIRDQKLEAAKGVKKEFDEATAQFEEAKKKVEALKTVHSTNEAEIASADEELKGLPDPEDLIPKVKRMRGELTKVKSDNNSFEATLANLVQRDRNAKSRIAETRKLIDLQSKGKSFPSLRTTIRSVYSNWGFVILSAGDTQGVVDGSTLDVLRGGEVIGKLKVTAVEGGRSSADIILNSVAEGVSLRSGDTVIAEIEAKEPVAAAIR